MTNHFRSYQKAGDKNGMAGVMGNTGTLLRMQGKLHDASSIIRRRSRCLTRWGIEFAAEALTAIGDVLLEEGVSLAITDVPTGFNYSARNWA